MKKYKLLISDYDGTLADSNGLISSENLISINSFIERGGLFVVCTGRATDSIKLFLKNQGFSGLVASFNGSQLVDLSSDKVLYSKGIPYDVCARFFEYTIKNNLSAHCYCDEGFTYAFDTKYTDSYRKLTKAKGYLCSDVISYLNQTKKASPKLLIFDDKEKLDVHFENICKLLPECDAFRSTDNMIDVNLKGVNKGSAIDNISAHFNLTYKDAIAVGDAGNDTPMLLRAGLPIAVSNAEEGVKKVAKIVAPKNSENAIKHIIENYCI